VQTRLGAKYDEGNILKNINAYDQPSNSLKIHFFYVVVILGGVIVLLATKHWTGLQGFTDYLSVAATITSLVLGVLAIIYSFVSSNSTNSSLGSIESAAQDIRSIGFDLRHVVAEGQELQKHAESKNQEFHQLVGDLRLAVDGISSTTTEIAGTIQGLPSQFGEIRDEMRKRAQSEPAEKSRENLRALWTPEALSSFLSNMSLLGLAAVKALSDAKASDKYTDLQKLFDSEKTKNFEYVWGFLVASSSAGIFRYETPTGTTLGKGKARFHEDSENLAAAIDGEWQKRAVASDASKRNSISRYTPLIAESLVSIAADI
jgi:hypothetical protein